MLKLLLKKQLMEVFRMYFYDTKKNKSRSKAGIIGMFVSYAVLMVGVFGGMFTFMCIGICPTLSQAGLGWLYFLIMTGISVLLGVFGSVFSTFSSLYLSKDNDFLLSMPVPTQYIIISRLLGVYLMGTLYSVLVILPAIVVYQCTVGFSPVALICGILLVLIISAVVLVMSCLLGWCVAKISLKIKNKSFVTVIISLAFIGLYYFCYFKANNMIQNLLANSAVLGEKIKGAAYWLYLLGKIGEGDLVATLIYIGISALLLALTWLILKKTFLSIATASGKAEKKVRGTGVIRDKGIFSALLGKEFKRFTSSPNYMLNCGLGILLIPVMGVLILIKGPDFIARLGSEELESVMSFVPIILCAVIMTLCSMNDMAAPSVSLEGKNIWILQSLPVEPKTVLRTKTSMHLILTGVPVIFSLICGLAVLKTSAGTTLLVILFTLIYIAFSALFSSFVGMKLPNVSWTNEIYPIKQGGAVMISIFGGWGIAAAFAILYFVIGYKIGTSMYLALWSAVLAALSVLALRWLDTKGAKEFSKL